MAVEIRPLSTRIQIQLDQGVDLNGKKIMRSKTLSNVKSNAADQDIYDVVEALTGLQTYLVDAIRKIAQSEMVNA